MFFSFYCVPFCYTNVCTLDSVENRFDGCGMNLKFFDMNRFLFVVYLERIQGIRKFDFNV